ncbi:hypothetical protein PCC9214_00073 [Planktothrix tepida]|uniref:Ribbon-helix-helix protein CopG domain-containing protein n=2 Tax=Planktothrix TaxID=54304 RepID=A0A1J1LHU3_9CYAN|nr:MULTISPECIES: hypothetical protein [Planktothrix]CAD5910966.1 hypothetical protein NO713_00037 [Planktothrix pseudagardhii]CAD5911571.1 hypothetical protein PCC9214_00073 [Planktothrix tepida]CUR32051.1 conserved hypothetical protein [Planktothrix tepida PCC 9214]
MSLQNIKIETSIPKEWASQLNQLSAETGHSVDKLVHEAIGHYLEKVQFSSISNSANLDASNLHQELLILQQKVQSLEPLLHQVAKLEAKIVTLEKIIIPEVPIIPNSTFAQLLTNDDDDDEPDEVLTDFLS